ncbi:MAG: hypothetical protein NTY51_10680 [Deltaproteobacteria bacterium]|nr:hypothetical protein [Deltaproteobacteria bacterium]
METSLSDFDELTFVAAGKTFHYQHGVVADLMSEFRPPHDKRFAYL